MVRKINSLFPLEEEIKRAFLSVRREIFVPAAFNYLAYKLDALPIASSQFISSPLTVAKMTSFLKPINADCILEIGCGSGYQAAVLSHLARRVFSIERVTKLYLDAAANFKKSKIYNVNIKVDDGQKGWSTYAPYDRILFSASLQSIPPKVISNLKEGGLLVAPIVKEGGRQVISRFKKVGTSLILESELEECVFVPVLNDVIS